MKSLKDNPSHLTQLCDQLDLGSPTETVTALAGGYHHRTWRPLCRSGEYVIKQLSAEEDLDDDNVVHHYNVTAIWPPVLHQGPKGAVS